MNGVNNIKLMVDNGNEARDAVGVSWIGHNGDREWVWVTFERVEGTSASAASSAESATGWPGCCRMSGMRCRRPGAKHP